MLNSQEQMEIIKSAIKSGYEGSISQLIEQAMVEKASAIQRDPEMPQAATPTLAGKIQPRQSQTTSTERNIIQPGQYKAGGFARDYVAQYQPYFRNLLGDGEELKLADKWKHVNNKETKEKEETWKTNYTELPPDGEWKRDGGVRKHENGGSTLMEFPEVDFDEEYEYYLMNFDEGGDMHGKEPVSLNAFERAFKTYGGSEPIMNSIFEGKDGQTSFPFSAWEESTAKRPVGLHQIAGFTEDQKTRYYNAVYPNLGEDGIAILRADDDKQIKALYKEHYNAEGPKDWQAGIANLEPSIAEQQYMSTPETWDDYNPWTPAWRATFSQGWNKLDRRTEYADGRVDYAPAYRFGDDMSNGKVFYKDKDGNPVGTHYLDGTPYTDELKNRKGYNSDISLSYTDDGSGLKQEYESGERAFNNTVAAATIIGGGPATANLLKKPVVAGWNLLNKNVVKGIGGTSVLDGLGYWGGYEGAKNIPTSVKNMANDPTWSNAGDVGLDLLGIGGGVFSTFKFAGNFRNVNNGKNAVNNINVTNTSKNLTNANASIDDVNNVKNVKTNENIITEDITEIISKSNASKHAQGKSIVEDAQKVYMDDALSVQNQNRITSNLHPDQAATYRNNLKLYSDEGRFPKATYEFADDINKGSKYHVNKVEAINVGPNTMGHSGYARPHSISGDTRFYNLPNKNPDDVKNIFMGFGNEPVPRFSYIYGDRILGNVKGSNNFNLFDANKFKNKLTNVVHHELDHSTKISKWRGIDDADDYTSNFSINKDYGRNQLGIINSEGVVNTRLYDFKQWPPRSPLDKVKVTSIVETEPGKRTLLDKILRRESKDTKYFTHFKRFQPSGNASLSSQPIGSQKNLIAQQRSDDIVKHTLLDTERVQISKKQADLLNRMQADEMEHYGNFLNYFTKSDEMSAKIAGLRGEKGIRIGTYGGDKGEMTLSEGKIIFNQLKNSKDLQDQKFWATFKDAESFTRMMNKNPYIIGTPITIGGSSLLNKDENVSGYRKGGVKKENGGEEDSIINKIKAGYNDMMAQYKTYEKEGYTIPAQNNPLINSLIEGYNIKGGFDGEDFTVYDPEGKKDKLRTNVLNTYENFMDIKSKVSPYLPHNIIKKGIKNVFEEGGERSIMFQNQNKNQNINLNLPRFNKRVRDPDLKNAYLIAGTTFLGSSGIRSLNTGLKQKKGKTQVYNDYIEAQGGQDFIDKCSTGNCPRTTYFNPDQEWFYNAANRAQTHMDQNDGHWWGSSADGTYFDMSALRAVRQGERDGTILSKEDLRTQYIDNIKKGAKNAIFAGGTSYLLNKALDNTRFGRKLQNKLGMDINIGLYRKKGGFHKTSGGKKRKCKYGCW